MSQVEAPAAVNESLLTDAKKVLIGNDMGEWTRPTAAGLYPHQWLWDSFFIAIGQRHYDIKRAMAEVRSPFRAQWKNGMVPHIIFSGAKGYHAGPEMWRSSTVSKGAPRDIETSGVTQPPVAAEAVIRIGQLLNPKERKAWYKEMYPKILSWHQWLYRERDPEGDGLVVLVLSWENGMDNTPPWMRIMHDQAHSNRVRFIKAVGFVRFLERFRKDTDVVPAKERISTIDLHTVYDLIKSLRRLGYDGRKIMARHRLQVDDLAFNCILMRANQHLAAIAEEIGEVLPSDIRQAIDKAPAALESLWEPETEQYYNRNHLTGQLVKEPSVSTFLPLYAQVLPPERVGVLLQHLHNPKTFGAKFPIPSAPLDSPYFKAHCYWQGPAWVDVNWLVAEGLEDNGLLQEAQSLRRSTLQMVKKGGMYEYFSPLDGSKAGAPTFSWTAALTIDLLNR
jgi:hypothetical protein